MKKWGCIAQIKKKLGAELVIVLVFYTRYVVVLECPGAFLNKWNVPWIVLEFVKKFP